MGISLNKLLKIGGLRHCKVVAGASGLEKSVSYVTVMEVPDIINWLKGEELLLTSLYPIKDDLASQIELIDRLHEVGTTAIAIKPHRFIQSIPIQMIEKANEYGIPIIEIPETVTYLDILSPAMNAIFDEKVVLQEDLDETLHRLNEISLNEQGFSHFIETLATLTKHNIYLESLVPYIEVPVQLDQLEPLTSTQIQELEIVQRAVRMARRKVGNEVDHETIVAPILVDGQLYGAITSVALDKGYVEMELAILERASMLLALEFLRKKVRYDIRMQYRNDFFRDLFLNPFMNKGDLADKGKIYGYSDHEEYVCISVSGKNLDDGKRFAQQMMRLETLVAQFERDAIIGTVRHALYILLPVKKRSQQELKKVIHQLSMEMRRLMKVELFLGVGRVYLGVDGLQKSFREAEQAVTFGPVFWNDQNEVYFDQIGIYKLISLVHNREELQQFYDETVGMIVEYDQTSESNLITTLEHYFKYNESLTETANQLFIHVNTLKYRLQKVKTISGLSLQKTEEKLMLNMGLKIHRFLESDYRFR